MTFYWRAIMKIVYKPSTSHWIFPPIILGILGVLLVIMIIQRAVICKKNNQPFIDFKKIHFFIPGYDKLKLFGTVILFVLYILLMKPIGFVFSSILCIFGFNVLFTGVKAGRKSIITSAIIAVVATIIIWVVFDVMFQISLP